MPEYNFKSVYFPKDRVRKNAPTRVNLSLPAEPKEGCPPEFIGYLKNLSSRQFRRVLGDPFLEDLEKRATDENRSLSNICVSILREQFQRSRGSGDVGVIQEAFDFGGAIGEDFDFSKVSEESAALGLTFRDSLRLGVHGWYPYLEGFSATYARDALLRDGKKPHAVYDPFGGAGTTQLSASLLGIKSFYSELNPVMSFIAETKVVSAHWARRHKEEFESLATAFIAAIQPSALHAAARSINLDNYERAFPERDFFKENDIRNLLAAIEQARAISQGKPHATRIFLLACVANAVGSSNMTRRADLRRRRTDEYKNRVVDVSAMITNSMRKMMADIEHLPGSMAPTKFVSPDAKGIPLEYENSFDLVLTSPPYLNGTNYFRNTKIELWLLEFISSERELRKYRDMAVTGGINDVSKKDDYRKFSAVEKVAGKLDSQSKDARIPMMVRHYFSDMSEVIDGLYRSLVKGGKLLLDIGDSKFYGVHVPTDSLLIDVARESGFVVKNKHVLARRMSRDKSELVQVELVLQKQRSMRKRH